MLNEEFFNFEIEVVEEPIIVGYETKYKLTVNGKDYGKFDTERDAIISGNLAINEIINQQIREVLENVKMKEGGGGV